jgi:hypothetical protein
MGLCVFASLAGFVQVRYFLIKFFSLEVHTNMDTELLLPFARSFDHRPILIKLQKLKVFQ